MSLSPLCSMRLCLCVSNANTVKRHSLFLTSLSLVVPLCGRDDNDDDYHAKHAAGSNGQQKVDPSKRVHSYTYTNRSHLEEYIIYVQFVMTT